MPSEVRYSEVKKMLEAKGYRFDRANGSHHVFVKPGCNHKSVPVHGGKVKYGYVRQIEKL